MWRELAFVASQSPHHIRLEFLSPGAVLDDRLTDLISEAEEDCDAVVLAMGGCVLPIRLPEDLHCPVILPRVHDCAGLMLGSKERQREVYNSFEGGCHWFLNEPTCHMLNPYRGVEGSVACLSSPVPGAHHACDHASAAAKSADAAYCEVVTDLELMSRLVAGRWDDEDFLTIAPGQKAEETFDLAIMAACEA